MPEEIYPQDVLFRRVFANLHIVKTENNRISSAAFKKRNKHPDPECSVYVGRLLSNPDEPMLTAKGGQVLVEFPASLPLSLDIAITHDPILFQPAQPHIPAQPGHAIIALQTTQQCSRIAAGCKIVPGNRGRIE